MGKMKALLGIVVEAYAEDMGYSEEYVWSNQYLLDAATQYGDVLMKHGIVVMPMNKRVLRLSDIKL